MEQPKIERLLRLMKMLTANNSLTVNEIAKKLSITQRSVYRYIETFRDAGFVIKKKDKIILLDKSSPYFKDISELIHFTEEEAYILKSAIENIDENNLLKQNLKKKLYTVYNYNILAETTTSGKNGLNVQRLVEAIEGNKKVILHNYSSAHGSDVRDRHVEAFAFTTNYVQIWCYCPNENRNKLFKVSRIGLVEVLPDPWEHENDHQSGYIDIFRMNSDEVKPIKLKLGLRSISLLTEEYPLSSKYIQRISDNEWLLETNVCTYEGIGRFVMGLIDDIKIIDSPEFANYLFNRIKKIENNLLLT